MRNRPGDSGLVARLDSLQHQINELTRRSASGSTCVVRLAANVGVPAGTDVSPITSWKSTAEADPAGLYHYNEDGDTYWQLPAGGRWHILVQSHWAAYGAFDASRPPVVSTSLLCNGTVPGNVGVAEASAFNYNINTIYPLVCEDQVFTTGDKLRVNFWSQYGGTVAYQQLQAFTHIVIRYLGAT